MVSEVNDEFSSSDEDPSFGGSGVSEIVSHEYRIGQLTLKVLWSSGDTTWEQFRDMRQDCPRKTAQYIVSNNVTRKGAIMIAIYNGLKRLCVTWRELLEGSTVCTIFLSMTTTASSMSVAPGRRNSKPSLKEQ